ncbi:MAG: PQQ-binding-like beta-propeller repeat protein [Phycisphaerales bacterium JB061]
MVRLAFITAAITVAAAASLSLAQDTSPVYVDDSPTAEQVLDQLPRLVAQENLSEAISVVQKLLDEEPYRLVVDEHDDSLFHSVRARLHRSLLESPDLLERYRLVQEPLARRLLGEGESARVARALLLTTSGAEASLDLAQRHYESARFDAAVAALAELDSHPDRTPGSELAARSARLLAEIAPLVDQDSVRALALRYADEAGLADEIDASTVAPIELPASARVVSADLSAAGAEFTPGELLPRPLRSSQISGTSAGGLSEASLLRGQRLSAGEPLPWIMPVLAGDLVFVNNMNQISAWDRVTLERVWSYAPKTESDLLGITANTFRRSIESSVEDSTPVVVGGGVALGITHDRSDRNRPSAPKLNALAVDTGELLWSIQPSQLKQEWHESIYSCPPVIVGDTAVCSLFQFSPLRRVMAIHTIGLDLYTGELRWSRLVGTAGVAPSQRLERIAHLALSDKGVVYRTDPLGVVSAIDAYTGEPIWIRKLDGEQGFSGSGRKHWQQPAPIIHDGSLIVLTPDELRLLVLDAETGEVIADRSASSIGYPEYLLRTRDMLVGVGSGISAVNIDDLVSGEAIHFGNMSERAPGRVRVAGEELLIPTNSGALLIDPHDPENSRRSVTLDYPGAPIAIGDQLIVADSSFVHTYLPWPTAEETLKSRLAQSPDDPDIALTYTELAYRAGAIDRVAFAASAALAAADRLGNAERALTARDRLYDSLLAMLTADRIRGGSLVAAQNITIKQRGELVDRLGEAARGPSRRVGYLMEVGRLAELQNEWTDAANAYQSILLDDSLTATHHTQGRRRQRAQLAAADAVSKLVRDHPRAYRAFDEQARELLKSLANPESPASPREYERLASRYPVSRSAPEALLAASDLHIAEGRLDRSIQALERAVDALSALSDRREPSKAVVGEIAGRLIRSLADADRLFAASQTLERIRADKPGLLLTYMGGAIDTEALANELAGKLASLSRLPRVGHKPLRMSQAVLGWSVVKPISTRGPVPRDHLLMYSRDMGTLALFGINSEATDNLGFNPEDLEGGGSGVLSPIWSRLAQQGSNASLVRLEPSNAILLWGGGDTASIELIDTVNGNTRWRTLPFGDLFEEEPSRRRTGLVETPLDGPSRLSDIMVVIGDQHIALVERTGRAAVFNLATGETVWSAMFDVPVVYEAAMAGGVLVIGGERPADVRAGEPAGVIPVVASYDIATREVLDIDDSLRSLFRWVRIDRAGRVLVGHDGGVVCTDPKRKTQLWAIDDPAVRLTGDAWLVRERAIVLGPDRQIWQIEMATGELRDAPLEDLTRVGSSSLIDIVEGQNSEVVFTTDRGMIVFDRAGSLIGGDAGTGNARVLPPVAGEGVFAMLASDGAPHFESGSVFRLSMLDANSGKLLGQADIRLPYDPDSLVLLDDHIIVSAGNSTLVYDAPVDTTE